jgi:hypothetical protein
MAQRDVKFISIWVSGEEGWEEMEEIRDLGERER